MRALPNLIAIVRALAVVPVVLLLDPPGTIGWALAVFSCAALTDAIDGPLARRLRATSALGAFLDPLADKVLVLGTLGALLARGVADPLAVGLILARETGVTAVRAVAAGRGLVLGSSAYGKAKAGLQATAVGAQLVAVTWPDLGLGPIAGGILWGVAAVTLVSGAEVVRRAAAVLGPSTPRAAHAR